MHILNRVITPHVFVGNNNQSAIVEPFLDGEFIKYISNEMIEDAASQEKGNGETFYDVVLALAHFSHEHTNGKLIITDLQGTGELIREL